MAGFPGSGRGERASYPRRGTVAAPSPETRAPKVRTRIPDDLPDVIADAAILTRVVVALAANALRRRCLGQCPSWQLPWPETGSRSEDSGPPGAALQPSAAREAPAEPDYLRATPPWHATAFALAVARDLTEAINGSPETAERTGEGLIVTVSLASTPPAAPAAGPTQR